MSTRHVFINSKSHLKLSIRNDMADATLLEENFTISSIISGKYDRVHRIVGTSQSGDIAMTLDVNIELFPVAMGDSVHLLVASTLSTEGAKDDSKGWRDVTRGEPTLADHYEYVCHGKVYRFEEGEGGNMYDQPRATEAGTLTIFQKMFRFIRGPPSIHGWTTQEADADADRLCLPLDEEDVSSDTRYSHFACDANTASPGIQ